MPCSGAFSRTDAHARGRRRLRAPGPRTHSRVGSKGLEPAGRADRALLFPVFPKGLFLSQWEEAHSHDGRAAKSTVLAHRQRFLALRSAYWNGAEQKLVAIAAHRSQLPKGDPTALFPPGIVSSLRLSSGSKTPAGYDTRARRSCSLRLVRLLPGTFPDGAAS